MPLPAVIHCTSPGGHAALVAQAVAVRHLAGQHVGDGLDAAMRMPRKAGQVIRRILVAKIVQQQERIELRGLAEAEGALQLHAGAFDGGFGFKNLFHCTKRHGFDLRLALQLLDARADIRCNR